MTKFKGINCNPHFKKQRILPTKEIVTRGGIHLQEDENNLSFFSAQGKKLGTWEKEPHFDLTALTSKTILDTFQFTEEASQQQRFDILEALAEYKTGIAIGRINDFLQLKGDSRIAQEGGSLRQIGAELVLASPKSQYLVLHKNPNTPKVLGYGKIQKEGRER